MAHESDTKACLVIDNPEALALAKELADLMKVSVEEAIGIAVRDELQAEREAQRRLARMEELAASIRERAIYPMVASDHSWLYDENGLPA